MISLVISNKPYNHDVIKMDPYIYCAHYLNFMV